jgi:transposase
MRCGSLPVIATRYGSEDDKLYDGKLYEDATAALCRLHKISDWKRLVSRFNDLGVSNETVQKFVITLGNARKHAKEITKPGEVAPNAEAADIAFGLCPSRKPVGTDRFSLPISEAYKLAIDLKKRIGVTRIGMITGLTKLAGVHVSQVARPDGAWSSSYGSGKSDTKEGAVIGGVMEETEKWAQEDSYSDTGRPSIDPELLLRILLIGYLYGVTSERKLVEELQMHLAWRWFTGLSFDQEIPHHSTFSKNRHGRFQESNLFQQLFEQIVDRCLEAGLVEGEHLSVDGSFLPANASRLSRIPREQLPEAAHVKRTVREYLADLEQENPIEEPAHQQGQVSTTDPDSTYSTKGDRPAELGYFNNYLIDNKSCVILGVQATAARLSQESAAAREMITRSAERRGRFPQSVAADTTYGNGELLA